MYTLIDSEKYILSEFENNRLLPLWSATQFAENSKLNGWENLEVKEIGIDFFEEELVDLITRNNYLLNIFPIGNATGFVVEINEFVRDLNEELENYK